MLLSLLFRLSKDEWFYIRVGICIKQAGAELYQAQFNLGLARNHPRDDYSWQARMLQIEGKLNP